VFYEEFETNFYNALKEHLDGNYPIEVYQSLLRDEPNNSIIKYLLAHSYYMTGNTEASDLLYDEAVKMNSNIDFPKDFSNIEQIIIVAYSTILTKENPYINEVFEKALESNLIWDFSYANTGAMYLGNCDLSNAYKIAMQGFEKFPASPYIRKLVYLTLLKSRNIAGAWGFYEDKVRELDENNDKFYMQKPLYDFSDRKARVYVYSSGSLSDTLFFARYIKPFEEEGVNILLDMPEELYPLFKMSNYKMNVLKPDLDEFDYRISMMSLPYLFKTSLENIPQKDGYLTTDETRYMYYNQTYFLTEKKKVGFTWDNDYSKEEIRTTMLLEDFIPLFEDTDIQFYSCKQNLTQEEKDILFQYNIVDLGTTFKNYADCAAAIANTDVFVGSDTLTLEIAAALGQKTIVNVPPSTEWKWGIWEEQTPWYSNVRVLRQKQAGNIEEVVERIKELNLLKI